jgi:FMN phosphatase YigB (HAD superfamily)
VAEALGIRVTPNEVLHVGDLHDLDAVAASRGRRHTVHLDRRDDGPFGRPCRMTTLRDLGRVVQSLTTGA